LTAPPPREVGVRSPATARVVGASLAVGALVAVGLAVSACAPRGRATGVASGEVERPAPNGDVPARVPSGVPSGGRVVRVALAENAAAPRVSATAAWTVGEADGPSVLGTATAGATWTVERRGDALRAVGPAGGTSWRPGPLVVRVAPGGFVSYGGRSWRGELWLHTAPAGGVTVVDRVPAEEYLRGVVPLELPDMSAAEQAAVQAQAVAARSYTYSRLAEFLPRAAAVAQARLPFDMRATVRDQVYGGVGVERPGTDRAILATTGLVLRYEGTVVSAPYHATCGGTTAAPDEAWGNEPAPYLRVVSDRVPGTDRAFCDGAPRYRWTREWEGAALERMLARYLRAAAGPPRAGTGSAASGPVGSVYGLDVVARSASGRAGTVAVRTTAGRYVLRGDAIRSALRDGGGAILPSTYFTATTEADGAGRVARLVVRGNGNGHGVGMCQWGAVGRARAGQDFRAILRTYYPGTTVDAVE
jgi:stage II sporulation protein D